MRGYEVLPKPMEFYLFPSRVNVERIECHCIQILGVLFVLFEYLPIDFLVHRVPLGGGELDSVGFAIEFLYSHFVAPQGVLQMILPL